MDPEINHWENLDWDELTFAINMGQCILLLGPEASIEKESAEPDKNEVWRPSFEILANQLSRETISDIAQWNINPDDLRQVSQIYMHSKSHNSLKSKTRDFFLDPTRLNLTSDMHRQLAKLPLKLIITTTFDKMMVNALKEMGKSPQEDFFDVNGNAKELLQEGTINQPLIYQLYGSLDQINSLVITENQLLDFLYKVAGNNPPLPKNLLDKLQNRENSLLFLGFGFRQWYFRVLLHVLHIKDKVNPSFALEKIIDKSLDEISRTNLFIQNTNSKIQVFSTELKDFVATLTQKYFDKYPAPEGTAIESLSVRKPPSAFISYVREHERIALDLAEKLRNSQINPLIDRYELKSGDNWEKKLEHLITKEANYFIYLLSHDLVNQAETVAYEEKDLALQRQRRVKEGLRFFLPLKIDDCEIPVELQELHVESDLNKIIEAIKSDFESRKT